MDGKRFIIKKYASVQQYVTRFNIGAVFTGQKAFDQANRALGKAADKAKRTQISLGRMFGAITASIGASALAYKALSKAQDLWREGVRHRRTPSSVYKLPEDDLN